MTTMQPLIPKRSKNVYMMSDERETKRQTYSISFFNSRLTHREFIKRYNFSVTHTKVSYPLTPSQAFSTPPPTKPDTPSSHGSASRTRRADRRSRRRRRSGYDFAPIICQSILESIGCFGDVDKENTRSSSGSDFRLGRTKIFLREDTVSLKH